jgi:peptidoglycan hydrolase CwlO-like protein
LNSARTSHVARLVAALAAAILVGALATHPVQADSTQTKKNLDAAKADLADLETKIAAENATIDSMRADMTALVTHIDHVRSRLATTQFKIVQKEQEIQDAQGQYDNTRQQLSDRAWVAYETGPGSSLEFLLGATSLSDLADRMVVVNSAAETDQDLIISIQEEQNRLRSKQAELESLETILQENQAQLTAQEKDLQKKLDAQLAVQQQLTADEGAAQKIVDDLRTKYNDQKAAEEALAKLQQQQGNQSFSKYNAFVRCPVPGAIFSDDFGAPRYGGGYHPHAGNDLFQSLDAPIYAPFPGNAVRDDNGLGGISVKVFGADGWVYNAHLDKVGTLGQVGTNTIIGYVGNTGDAQGGAYHDHFEFHPYDPSKWPNWKSPYGYTQIGDAVDPYPFLKFRCG